MCRIPLCVLSLALFVVTPAFSRGQSASEPVKVTYTGRLYGYYRMEAGEDRATAKLQPVQKFLNVVSPTGGDNLLLGMGDNFGPEFGAAIQLIDPGSDCKLPIAVQGPFELPKDIYKTDIRIANAAHCDNVAHFLQAAGYRAVVPGREDLIYTITWLNRIAVLMRDDLGHEPVNMLAANLRIKYNYAKSTAADSKVQEEQFCPLALSDDLMPNLGGSVPCKQQDVADPELFEQYLGLDPTRRAPTSQAIQKEENGIGYTVEDLGPGRRVLLIGVIGQDVIKSVSPANLVMCLPEPGTTGPGKPEECDPSKKKQLKGTVSADDPVKAVAAVLLATQTLPEHIDYRILMAQMPHTEAEELVSALRSLEEEPGEPSIKIAMPQLDLVISEAQPDHASTDFTLTENGITNGDRWAETPVVTPTQALGNQGLVRPDWTATLNPARAGPAASSRTMGNAKASLIDPWQEKATNEGDWTVHLLMAEVEALNKGVHFMKVKSGKNSVVEAHARFCYRSDVNYPSDPRAAAEREETCKVVAMQFLLDRMQLFSNADITMLERRDMFLGTLPYGYADQPTWCDPRKEPDTIDSEGRPPAPGCTLRVALDRVLWKGDYAERTMASGKDINAMIAQSKTISTQEQSLAPKDIAQQWLETTGIATPTKPNEKTVDNEELALQSYKVQMPEYENCLQVKSDGTAVYCVNGRAIDDDHAYSVATSDHLAEEDAVYGIFSKLPKDYRERRSNDFLTRKIAATIIPIMDDGKKIAAESKGPEGGSTELERLRQQRGIFQIDIAKMVAGFNLHAPQGGDTYVQQAFQGAADARASSVYTLELDLESKLRSDWKSRRFSVGAQSDEAYDRSVQGNLLGNTENANYALNNATVGGFLQLNIPPFDLRTPNKDEKVNGVGAVLWDGFESAMHANKFLVLSPYQYQRQIDGAYLFIPFNPSQPGTKNELTPHLPVVNGYSNKVGYRWEAVQTIKHWYVWDPGSYGEVGMELTVQNNILSTLTLASPGTTPFTCDASSSTTIANCFKQAKYRVNASTQASFTTRDLDSSGFYWDAHFQKNLVLPNGKSPAASIVVETLGDSFFRRAAGRALSTQTLYDVPLSVSLAFPVFRNFSLAPTYTGFFYGSQVTAQHLVVDSFTINARWYFDRDAAVRGIRQIVFSGPASADQTKSAKMK